jgi:wobble nucleotide-excising tRNase
MLRRVIAIKNVGRFRNSADIPNPQLAKHTLIFAANAYGKTTFCTVMRSAQSEDATLVIGRRTLGTAAPPEIDLLFDDGNRRFRDGAWSAPAPNISVFDGVFVAENVHSGDVVDITHRRNLYRVIVGSAGIGLAQREQELAEQAREKQAELTAGERAAEAYAPRAMRLRDFIELPDDPEIGEKIEAQRRSIESLRQAEAIRTRPPLALLPLPAIPLELRALLVRSIEGLTANAEARLAVHLERHEMQASGERWISEGMAYVANDECPFCGRGDIAELRLFQAFRSLFSEAYRQLQTDITSVLEATERCCGEVARAALQTTIAQNLAASEFWQHHCDFGANNFPAIETALTELQRANDVLMTLLDRKAGAPLEPIDGALELDQVTDGFSTVARTIEAYNANVVTANALITTVKNATASGDLASAQAKFGRLQTIQSRYQPEAIDACDKYLLLEREKQELETRKSAVRQQLEDHTNQVVRPYENRINYYLDLFNAGFSITRTGHGYPGGVAASTYQLRINGASVDLGDARTQADRPSFKNTLSASDRVTLALAFFLAHLEREPDLADRTIIFDDPFSSQDAFRRRQTIYEIMRIGNASAQIVVLSHDAIFLKQLWEKCPPDNRASLQIIYHPATGSKLSVFDLDDACRGRAAAELDDLLSFRSTGSGNLREIIKKLRVVLETYFRSTFPGAFLSDDNLGTILQKIRESGKQHPAHGYYETIERINDYTADYHHGEDPRGAAEPPVDRDELMGFVQTTLRMVNALPA